MTDWPIARLDVSLDERRLGAPESLGERRGGDVEFGGDVRQGRRPRNLEVAQFVGGPECTALGVGQAVVGRPGPGSAAAVSVNVVANESVEGEADVVALPERPQFVEGRAVGKAGALDPAGGRHADQVDGQRGLVQRAEVVEVVQAVAELFGHGRPRSDRVPARLALLNDEAVVADEGGRRERVLDGGDGLGGTGDGGGEARLLFSTRGHLQRDDSVRDPRRHRDEGQGVTAEFVFGAEGHARHFSPRKKCPSNSPRFDGAVLYVLGTPLAVGVVGVETRRTGRLVELDGAALGVPTADDLRLAGLVLGQVGERAPLGRGESVSRLRDLPTRRGEGVAEVLCDTVAVHVRANDAVGEMPVGARPATAFEGLIDKQMNGSCMCPPQRTRRSLLRASGVAATALATGTLAGCLGDSTGPGETPGADGTAAPTDSPTPTPTPAEPAALADVPAFADAVASVDVDGLLDDAAVRGAYGAWVDVRAEGDGDDGPTTLAAALDDLADEEGFDLRDLSSATVFLAYGDTETTSADEKNGFLLESDWDVSAPLSIVGEPGSEYTETTYGGHAVHRPREEWGETVGVLGDGHYVVGGRQAVEGAIDVVRGEAEAVDGSVVDAYRASAAGPVRSATTVQRSWFPEDVNAPEQDVDLGPLRRLETAAAGIYRDGDVRGVEARLAAPDGATAEDLVDVLETLRSLAAEGSGAAVASYLESLVADATVARDGATVTVTVERTVDELESMATEFGELTAGVGGDTPSTPAAQLDFAYDDAEGTVTITHDGGDHLEADRLYVRGEGFADADGADMTAPGQWAGTIGEDGVVSAGDHVVVGVESDFVTSVVWEGEDASATLGMDAGPEA